MLNCFSDRSLFYMSKFVLNHLKVKLTRQVNCCNLFLTYLESELYVLFYFEADHVEK